jgi:WD40 repeat protein
VAVGRGRRVALVSLEGAEAEGPREATRETETEAADAEDEAEQKSCCFDRSGKRLVVGGTSGRVRVLDATSLELLHEETPRAGDGPVSRLCASPHGSIIAALSPACVRVYELDEATGALKLLARHEAAALSRVKGAQLRGAAFAGTPGAPVLAVGAVSRPEKRSQVALVGGAAYGEVQRVFSMGNEPQTCLCASQDGSLLAVGTAEGTVSVWSLKRGPELVMTTRPHSFFVSGVCFSPDGTHVLSVSGDRTLQTQLVVARASRRNAAGLLLLLALLILLLAVYWLK